MKILQDGEQGVRIDSNFNSNSNSILTPWWRVTFYITGSVWWNHWRPPKGDNDNKICGPWRDFVSTWPHMYTMVASYQEPSEIPEEILINKLNTEVGLKTKYSYKYYQSTADCCNPYNSQKLHTVSQMRHSFVQLCSWVFKFIKVNKDSIIHLLNLIIMDFVDGALVIISKFYANCLYYC